MDKLNKRQEIIEERISEMESRKREIIQYERQRENKLGKEMSVSEICGTINGVPEDGPREGLKMYLKE